jgi:hypothetical protein
VAAAAADLLDQGATINRLSRPLTIAALIGLIVGLGVELGALLVAGLLLVTLAGLAETYLAIRTGFDAKLFRRLEARGAGAELEDLDRSAVRDLIRETVREAIAAGAFDDMIRRIIREELAERPGSPGQ